MRAGAVESVDTGCVGNKDWISATNEEAAFDDPDDVPNALLQSGRIADAPEVAIENAVATVGDERLACRRHAQPNAGTEHFKRLLGCLQSERHHFHRNCCSRTQPINKFGPINDDCERYCWRQQRSSHAARRRPVL